jgi:hypothetical protein
VLGWQLDYTTFFPWISISSRYHKVRQLDFLSLGLGPLKLGEADPSICSSWQALQLRIEHISGILWVYKYRNTRISCELPKPNRFTADLNQPLVKYEWGVACAACLEGEKIHEPHTSSTLLIPCSTRNSPLVAKNGTPTCTIPKKAKHHQTT